MKTERLGIYGGSFSPPHRGHTEAAAAFFRAAELDKLLIIPALIPPHKALDGEASPEERLAMCRLAFSGLPRTKISDCELRRGGKSYSVLTLRELASPGRELFMLVGTDMFLTLDEWHLPEEIFSLASIVLIRRECDPENTKKIREKTAEFQERYGAKLLFPNTRVVQISSEEVRAALREGEDVSPWLAPEVEGYIRQCHLYRV